MKWFFVLLLLVTGLSVNAAFTPLRTTNGGVSIADTKRITFSGFPATNQNNGRLLITSPYSGSIFNGDLAQIFTSNGLLARTASNTFSGRTITTDNGLSITNADGVSGNPRLTFDPSSLTGLVPYTGATSDVDIGTYDLITDAIKADGSGGLQLDTNSGNRVLLLGAGGGTSATAYGTWNFNGATASTIASFGAGKGLESLSTSTYPSLTELSYVKGVTSAIQTQINTKSSEANGGTMRSIQFTGDNGISFNVSSLSGNGGALRLSNNLALSTYTNDAGFLTGNQTITLSGDVTGSGTTGITTTIANSAITSGKILNGTILVADIDNGTHGYYMKSVNGSVVWATAGSSDAATLDGLDSTQFLRSDASDSYTSGTLTLDAGTTFDVNSTAVSIADTNISFDGASTTFTGTGAMSIIPGAGTNFLVQQSQNGTSQFKNTSGSVITILNSTSSYGNPSATNIFGDAVVKFQQNGVSMYTMGFRSNGNTFRINDAGNLNTARFLIDTNGNVGINDTTPTRKLDVAGSVGINGNTVTVPSLGQGSLLYAKQSGTLQELTKGTNHHALKVNGNRLAWEAISSGSGGGTAIDVQSYTTNGTFTWTKPSGATFVRIVLVGGGGGGGSGRKGAVGTLRRGGWGGSSGGMIITDFLASQLNGSYAISIGRGGVGGASQTTNSTNGNFGTNGDLSYFGGLLKADGGHKGSFGNNTTANPGGSLVRAKYNFSNQMFFSTTATGYEGQASGSTGGYSGNPTITVASSIGAWGSTGGGAGGGVTTGNAPVRGANGTTMQTNASSNINPFNFFIEGGAKGTINGGNASAGNISTFSLYPVGTGGGGGGSSTIGNGGNGGNGVYGAGGGGGGASVDSVGNSGAGGKGGNGFCMVISW